MFATGSLSCDCDNVAFRIGVTSLVQTLARGVVDTVQSNPVGDRCEVENDETVPHEARSVNAAIVALPL
jgi:hypothetical protein